MFKTSLVALFISIVINGIFYCALRQPAIATVDILSITTQFINDEAQKKHSKFEKELAIKNFSHRLEQALKDLSRSKELVLVPREAVIKGGHDYTSVLMDMVGLEPKS